MVDYVNLVESLFSAYGRVASEQQIRSYSAVIKQGEPAAIKKAIVEATNTFDQLPTAPQILKLSREIQKNAGEQGQRNKVRHQKIVDEYYQQALKAGWSLAQRDELMDVCDAAINRETGEWKWTEEKLRREVAEIVYAVDDYRRRCEEAEQRGETRPDEAAERWAWAIDPNDWNPAKESLWDYVKRCVKF